MGLYMYVKMICDHCGASEVLEDTEEGEFYSDYLYTPEEMDWVETYPRKFESELLCPPCFKKAIEENPNLENTSEWRK